MEESKEITNEIKKEEMTDEDIPEEEKLEE